MNFKKKVILVSFLIIMFIINIVGEQITNGIISEAYKPYKGIVVVLDAGHGGKDNGAEYGNINEKDLNLLMVEKLKIKLEQLGMKVNLTRKNSNDLASADATNRKQEDIKKRMKLINKKETDFFISIHMNAYADSDVHGSQIFYSKGDSDSHQFASDIQTSLVELTNSKMQVKEGDYYLLKNAKKMGILLECGFLSNVEERNRLLEEGYQDNMVEKIKEGIMTFLKRIYE